MKYFELAPFEVRVTADMVVDAPSRRTQDLAGRRRRMEERSQR